MLNSIIVRQYPENCNEGFGNKLYILLLTSNQITYNIWFNIIMFMLLSLFISRLVIQKHLLAHFYFSFYNCEKGTYRRCSVGGSKGTLLKILNTASLWLDSLLIIDEGVLTMYFCIFLVIKEWFCVL